MTKMKSNEWMPLTVGHFVRDTMDLTTVEIGAYCLLSMHYWCRGPIPNVAAKLATITRRSLFEWNRISGNILQFFKEEDGLLHHKRLDAEREQCADLSEKRSIAGKAGVEARRRIRLGLSDNEPEAIASDLLNERLTQVQVQEEEVPPSPSEKSPKRVDRSQGSRLTADWRPPEDDWKVAVDLGLDPCAVLAMFRDYWIAAPGKAGRKVDWPATWRNWCRREAERLKSRRPGPAELPFLTPIAGGKDAAPVDANDPWGIESWCKAQDGVTQISGADAKPEVLAKGKWAYRGKIIDHTARKVAEAAGWQKSWRGDWSPLAQWIDEGMSTNEHIIPTVQRLAAWFRSNGQPATGLRAFDKAIRERKAA